MPQIVKLGSQEAVEIPSSRKEKGGVQGEKNRNDGLDQVHFFDVCSESGSPRNTCLLKASLFLYWAHILCFPSTPS